MAIFISFVYSKMSNTKSCLILCYVICAVRTQIACIAPAYRNRKNKVLLTLLI